MAQDKIGNKTIAVTKTDKNGVQTTKMVELVILDGKLVASDSDPKNGVER